MMIYGKSWFEMTGVDILWTKEQICDEYTEGGFRNGFSLPQSSLLMVTYFLPPPQGSETKTNITWACNLWGSFWILSKEEIDFT